MIRSNPDTLFVFGDNLIRKGLGGQAREMRGEPNAVGIVTKKSPSMDDDSFLNDEEIVQNIDLIYKDFQPVIDHLDKGGKVTIPFDGLGTGLAQLPERAPQTWKFLESFIEYLHDKYNRV